MTDGLAPQDDSDYCDGDGCHDMGLAVTRGSKVDDERFDHAVQGHSVHNPECESCISGRVRRKMKKRTDGPRVDQRGVAVYIDLMGPFEADLMGNVYEMTLTEGNHGWIEVVGLKDKSAKSTSKDLKAKLRDLANRSNQKLGDFGRVHSDQGSEFKGEFDEVLTSLSMTHTDTGGYSSSANPAENAQGRIQQTARAVLHECTGGHEYYRELRGLALMRAVYCMNRRSEEEGTSAYFKSWGQEFKWDKDDSHVFGARCLYLVHDHEREKFESKCRPGLWVGRNLESNGHMVVPLEGWDPVEKVHMLGKPVTVNTMRVFDDQFPLRCVPLGRNHSLVDFQNWVDRLDPRHQHAPNKGDSPLTHDKLRSQIAEQEYLTKAIIGKAHRGRGKRYYVEWDESDGGTVTLEPAANLHPDLIREYELRISEADKALAVSVMDSNSKVSDIEKMVAELLVKQNQIGQVSDWVEAVEKELNTVKDLRFEEVDDETRDRVLRDGIGMRLRMILEMKKDLRKKGRLVGQGFWEGVGLTGMHVDSPVASFATIRTLLFKAGLVGEVIGSGDIGTAFLLSDDYPPDSEPRYVRFRMYKGGPEHVWRLKGPLYGSRDSSKLSYESFRKFMRAVEGVKGMGFELSVEHHGQSDLDQAVSEVGDSFEQGCNEPCVFKHPVTGLIVVLFVDDIITRGMPDVTNEFYERLNKRYPLRSWNILSVNNPLRHLGFTITEELVEGELHRYMSQADDVHKFLGDHGLEGIRNVNSPMPNKYDIVKDPELLSDDDVSWFKSMVGSMSWFAVSLRWDIAHSISRLQQFGASPTMGALNAAVRVAMYLATTADFKLGGKVCYGKDKVKYYTDSDHAGDKGMTTKSHTGIMLVLNGVPVHWRSKKQPKTVLSPAHAEIYACSEGIKEARAFQWVASELGMSLPWPMIIHVDNQQVISFQKGSCVNSKLKGMIDTRESWVRELRDDGMVEVVKVKGELNWADILTKCIVGWEFVNKVKNIQEGGKQLELRERAREKKASALTSQDSGGQSSLRTLDSLDLVERDRYNMLTIDEKGKKGGGLS